MNNEEKILFVMENIEGEISVSELAKVTGIRLSNISQYWKKLKKKKLINARIEREGRKKFVFLSLTSSDKMTTLKNLRVVETSPSEVKSSQSSSQEESLPIRVESKKDFDEMQAKKFYELMTIISLYNIKLGEWVTKQVFRYKLVPAIESFEKIFPQMTKDEIALVSNHFRAQGYAQRTSPFDDVGLIKPIVEE